MSGANRLRVWAEDVVARYEADVARLIGAVDVPPIEILVERSGPAAAWTDGTRVFLNARWFAEHPDDAGGVLHELTHAIMRAPAYDDSTRWLIEGIADYVRDVLGHDAAWTTAHFSPGNATAGYQETAHFLLWLEARHPGTVQALSRELTLGAYRGSESFARLTTTPLDGLVTDYEAEQRTR